MRDIRLNHIEEYIHSRKNVTLDELCLRFDVSKNTIRRDINQISEKGTIQKVYGGVVSNPELVSFKNRTIKNQSEKHEIGRLAASCIEENDLIFIDSGTTTRYMVHYLDPDKPLTILTNSLDVINGVSSMPNVDLFVVGNFYKRNTESFIGLDDPHSLDKYNVNKAFMSVTGVSDTHGLTNSDPLEYEIKKIISEKAKKLILLADASKFGKSTLLTYAPLSRVDTIITSQALPREYQEFCAAHDIEIRHAHPDEEQNRKLNAPDAGFQRR
ncbi:DeoR/GlpR family DNA-binding transcription regulator [Paenibacillus mucilaginosus]|uniref:IolR n=1 Tax=Paenibacillus mucilaginosus (strain KNP414) TaxID=1036673 RepID=F8FR55_PAEMK|nr:DeoR/GlpR family DNA-binding transcription regulator [Paenibacillus mucilaginosus]AEI40493.1 IolR [Paenibacillus mucilaginosus KNP414]MCG7213163.1 DeoR/GlpR family DNA-binding transcription regulator [Paenibacillus mucilaginosus]WDM29667.1 DeoR/GlpR transcriptional regulator [Paenibacillus mucilaginosus]